MSKLIEVAHIRKLVERIMISDEISTHRFLRILLLMLSFLYGALMRLRGVLFRKAVFTGNKLPCMVISVGNITLGGTGKTPMVIYLARRISTLGYGVAIVSRGYKGAFSGTGGIVSDGQTIFLPADASGDEPQLMAKLLDGVPVLIGKDRHQAGLEAVKKYRPDILLLDDGFQHLKLERDLNIVLVDALRPFGNGHVFPRGVLREPLSALARGDVFVMTRSESKKRGDHEELQTIIGGKPLFQSVHRPYIQSVRAARETGLGSDRSGSVTDETIHKQYHGAEVVVFSGIAKNDDLRKSIVHLGFVSVGYLDFDDHHWYADEDIQLIANTVTQKRARAIVTTLKDAVRIPSSVKWPVDLIVLDIEIDFPDTRFDVYLKTQIRKQCLNNNTMNRRAVSVRGDNH